MIHIISPCNKIEYVSNAINNFKKPDCNDKILHLVLNGEAINEEVEKAKNIRTYRIRSKSVGELRNVALDMININELVFFFDSDDYYESNYILNRLNINMQQNYIYGNVNIQITDLCDTYKIKGMKSKKCHGPTLLFLKNKNRFDDLSFAEDLQFQDKFEKIIDINKYENDFTYFKSSSNECASFQNLNQLLNTFKLHASTTNNKDFIIERNGKIIFQGCDFDINDIEFEDLIRWK
jgi:hypothetical protein